MTTSTKIPRPSLRYGLWHSAQPFDVSEVRRSGGSPLYAAHAASASLSHDGTLRVVLEGPQRKRDGGRGQHNRCATVALDQPQPEWLRALIADARRRLEIPTEELA